MCVCLCVIEYVRILVLGINLVSFYKELSLECDFKYFFPYLCHDRAPLSDSLLPLTATCGGLFTSCHWLPHVGEQSVLIHSTERSISLTPVSHLPFPIYSGLCPLSVSVCQLWFVLPVVGDLLSLICILCPGSPGEE